MRWLDTSPPINAVLSDRVTYCWKDDRNCTGGVLSSEDRRRTSRGHDVTSTFIPTRSAARLGSRSRFPSSNRYSMAMIFGSTYPRSRRPCRNPSNTAGVAPERPEYRRPIRGTIPACWAFAATGHPTAAAEEADELASPHATLSCKMTKPGYQISQGARRQLLHRNGRTSPRSVRGQVLSSSPSSGHLNSVSGVPPIPDITATDRSTYRFVPLRT